MKKSNLILLITAFVLSIFAGCSRGQAPEVERPIEPSGNDPTLNRTEARLRYDGTFLFEVRGATGVSWHSSDEFVGTIDQVGRLTAHHVGETTVTASFDGKALEARVIVEPYVIDIREPYTGFGAAVQEVRSWETRTLLVEGLTKIEDEEVYIMLYRGQGNKERELQYWFEDDQLGMGILTLNVRSNTEALDVQRFYRERYRFVEEESDDKALVFLSKDSQTLVAIMQRVEQGRLGERINVIAALYISYEDYLAEKAVESQSRKNAKVFRRGAISQTR